MMKENTAILIITAIMPAIVMIMIYLLAQNLKIRIKKK